MRSIGTKIFWRSIDSMGARLLNLLYLVLSLFWFGFVSLIISLRNFVTAFIIFLRKLIIQQCFALLLSCLLVYFPSYVIVMRLKPAYA